MPASHPNVVLFIPHDAGRHLAQYGIDAVHTPNAGKLAQEGIRFTNAFCTSPLCSPSRAACVTGRYPHQNGVMGLTGDPTGAFDLYPTERHAAQIFSKNGYESVLCGSEHESRDCTRLGFDCFLNGSGTRSNGGGDLRETGSAVDTWLTDRDADKPFYLQIGCHETHKEWTAYDTPPDDSLGVWMPPYLNDLPELRQEMAEFQGAVGRLDEGLGAVLDALDSHGVADDTVVVFTTDHGIDVPRAKGTCYDPGLEVFLLIRYPNGQWETGSDVNDLISNVDLLPTLLDICGIPVPAEMAGHSFHPRVTGENWNPNEAVFAEKTFHDTYDPIRCIRTSRYKYIRYFEVNIFEDLRLATMTNRHYWRSPWHRKSREAELYDLQADPLEMNDLAGSPDVARVEADLRHQLAAWMKETDDPLLNGPVASPYYAAHLDAFLSS